MLKPKKTKYKKYQKSVFKKKQAAAYFFKEYKKKTLKLISLQAYRLTAKQIETARISIIRKLKRANSKLELKIFPDIAVTKKPNEIRMGKGKGNVEFWATKINKGSTIFEIHGGILKKNVEALTSGSKKLPIQTIIKY